MGVDIHPEAGEELMQAAHYYDDRTTGLGDRFTQAVNEVFHRLANDETRGAPWIAETRLQSVRGFPYGIVFRIKESAVNVLAVYHYSRHENYWLHRLDD